MNWHEEALERLADKPLCGYGATDGCATEPTALAALALTAYQRLDTALEAANYLKSYQNESGSIGVRPELPEPCWSTSLAVLAWSAIDRRRFDQQIRHGLQWILSIEGNQLKPSEQVGHDTTLVAWPWVDGTHSWIEPTALNVLTLKAAGLGDHPRTRQAVRLLLDRQLPGGGCNYGNTKVLGQTLRPHVQPTGLAMLALAGAQSGEQVIRRSLSYLRRSITEQTATASLCWALIGLAAHGEATDIADAWLAAAYERTVRRDGSRHKLALLVHAALGTESPLVRFVGEGLTA